MRRIAAALAALTLIAAASHAQGQGKADGNEPGGPSAEAGQRGGGKADNQGNPERGHRGQGKDGPSMAQSMRGPERRDNAERGHRGDPRRAESAKEREAAPRVRDFASAAPRGLIEGCPPGLARKSNGCQPPGRERGLDRVLALDRPDFWGLTRLGDGSYFYHDGYLVRYAPAGGILGYVPLLGGALTVGNAWPKFYRPAALPDYYERYFGLGSSDSYRYADDVIYEVDPATEAITSIVALLAGDDFAIGQPLPRGYDVYNVPYGYRDRYLDGPDALYRYSDGYIYRIDPRTRLIAAAIELLAA